MNIIATTFYEYTEGNNQRNSCDLDDDPVLKSIQFSSVAQLC